MLMVRRRVCYVMLMIIMYDMGKATRRRLMSKSVYLLPGRPMTPSSLRRFR